jgi:DNA-3-methyladenine glycosylase I
MAAYDEARQAELLQDARIIRNRAKVRAFRDNARATLALRQTEGGLSTYLWAAVGGQPIVNAFETAAQVPAQTDASEELSRDLKRRGFRFVGPVIVYAFMQSAGLVNDHTLDCFRRSRAS